MQQLQDAAINGEVCHTRIIAGHNMTNLLNDDSQSAVIVKVVADESPHLKVQRVALLN